MNGVSDAMAFEQSSPHDDLFSELGGSRGARWGLFGLHASVLVHGLAIAGLVLVPLLTPATMPELPADPIVALIYNPPPPPPPPKLLGIADVADVVKPTSAQR